MTKTISIATKERQGRKAPGGAATVLSSMRSLAANDLFAGHPQLAALMAEHDAENRMIGRAFAIAFIIGCAADLLAWLF